MQMNVNKKFMTSVDGIHIHGALDRRNELWKCLERDEDYVECCIRSSKKCAGKNTDLN